MHISEGVLSPPVLAAGWALAAGGLAVGLRKTATEKLPETALVSSALFLASLVRVPLGPSSIHLTMLGIAGIMLGWSSFPALFVALFLQGLLFQFGGLLSLGVNSTVMGSAALAGYMAFRALSSISGKLAGKLAIPAAFLGGFVAVMTGTILVSLSLFFSGLELRATAVLLFAANVPLALVEGVISVFIVAFLKRIKPDYVSGPA